MHPSLKRFLCHAFVTVTALASPLTVFAQSAPLPTLNQNSSGLLSQASDTRASVPGDRWSYFQRNRGNTMNPAMGANSLFLYSKSREGNRNDAPLPNGTQVQEVELALAADVDPYSRLAVLLSIHPEADPATGDSDFHLDAEEVFVESLAVPYVTLRAGKFLTMLGKHNQLHTHAMPFIDAPLFQAGLLNHELGSLVTDHSSYNDAGASASALVPVPWYFEATVQLLSGQATSYFGSRSNNDIVTLARLLNLWDITDSSTLEFGLSGASGDNRFGGRTDFLGADLTFKWRPVEGGRGRAFVWSTEVLRRVLGERGGAETEGVGLSTWMQFQFSPRWWVQARTEWLNIAQSGDVTAPNEIAPRINKSSALVGYFPSEFSGVRFQYDFIDAAFAEADDHRFLVQLNFSIGAHPAHAY